VTGVQTCALPIYVTILPPLNPTFIGYGLITSIEYVTTSGTGYKSSEYLVPLPASNEELTYILMRYWLVLWSRPYIHLAPKLLSNPWVAGRDAPLLELNNAPVSEFKA